MFSFNKITLICVGKIKKSWIKEGIEHYLKLYPSLKIIEVKDNTRAKEAQSIINLLNKNTFLILLDENGPQMRSLQFCNFLQINNSLNLTFVISGSEGLSRYLKKHTNQKLSLSLLTFPHELARLLLIEQIYRASTIFRSHPYHRS